MKTIPMSLQQVEAWTTQYSGSRDGIHWDGEHLHVPDELFAVISAIDTAPDNPAHLATVKATLKKLIDEQAERERLKYITAGAGQAMTYAQKAEEARQCLGASAPAPEDYPLLAAEIGITAPTLVGVAQVVSAANSRWLIIGAAIEAARLAAKNAIELAATLGDAEEAAAQVSWPVA